MATSTPPKLETAPEPPERRPKYSKVTPEYRKAHKNYVLVAALLASWELIGIELNTEQKFGVKLLSPKAVPLILFTLLFYFGYKVVIEWKESDGDRSKSGLAQFDYSLSHIIGASAVLIGLVQYLTKIRVADYIAAHATIWQTAILAFYAISGLFMGFVVRNLKRLKRFWRIAVAVFLASEIIGYLFKGWRGIVGAIIVIALLIVMQNMVVWSEPLIDRINDWIRKVMIRPLRSKD